MLHFCGNINCTLSHSFKPKWQDIQIINTHYCTKGRKWWKGVPCAGKYGNSHDDVIKWKHFPRYWPFVRGIHLSPVNSPHKGQWRRALMFTLICAWINGCVNNREAGDLRRFCAHYGVTVMWLHGVMVRFTIYNDLITFGAFWQNRTYQRSLIFYSKIRKKLQNTYYMHTHRNGSVNVTGNLCP